MANKFKRIEIAPDPVYDNFTVAKLINQIMTQGKKSAARKIVYGAFDVIKEKTKKDPVEVLENALNAVGPAVEVRPRRVGGATYQVPIEVNEKRRMSLAMRWIIEACNAKKGQGMKDKLANELMQSANNEGEAIKKRVNVEKMAAANKAFAHLARRG